MAAALIVGLSGLALTADERAFLADVQPAGLILFKRNISEAGQIRRLVADARAAIGREEALVLIDQEGGRVQRIKAPIARDLPAAQAFARQYTADAAQGVRAAFAVARLAAAELAALGINMNCAPVVDRPVEGAHDIIGDRAYGRDCAQIIALARAVGEGLMAGGVAPVIKHVPGHGRATADSHLDLPVVATAHRDLSATDFVPFKALADMPAAMTAHVVFSDIDAAEPASTSARIISEIIRGEIGFDGLVMSDDLSMHALKGPMRARAEAVIAAGCDVALHCNGDMSEMVQAAAGVARLEGRSLERFARAYGCATRCEAFDESEALALLEGVRAFAA